MSTIRWQGWRFPPGPPALRQGRWRPRQAAAAAATTLPAEERRRLQRQWLAAMGQGGAEAAEQWSGESTLPCVAIAAAAAA